MTVELVVFSGLQASGKTTFYRSHLARTHVHVSKDAWPNARNRERRQQRLITEALAAGQSVVVDNTNPSPIERRPLIALGRLAGARLVSFHFVSTVEASLARNGGRAGRARVADVGIFTVAGRLVAPGAGEGFNERYEVQLVDGSFVVTSSPLRV